MRFILIEDVNGVVIQWLNIGFISIVYFQNPYLMDVYNREPITQNGMGMIAKILLLPMSLYESDDSNGEFSLAFDEVDLLDIREVNKGKRC